MAPPRRRANSREDVGQFTRRDAGRIAAATIAFEQGNRNRKPVKFKPVASAIGSIRICRTQFAWGKGTLSDLVLMEGGVAGGETDNFPEVIIKGAVNLFADVEAGKAVAIASAGNGRWYLIAAEC